ncbi:lactonase family protein [Leptospira harrisiae]|uniref:lactonase family protein n=1 Tax=Leptospira harrisiae TaxID=2023189 RepID=UPI0013FD32E4|nr:beta-propeller fold lactonase family protein [Leptospira harrisiae]
MKNQFKILSLFLCFYFFLFYLNCSPAKLNGTCDPKSESFLISALLEFGSDDGKYLCASFAGLNPFRFRYESDYFVIRQNETIVPMVPFASEPIEFCKISPSLPTGLVFNPTTCVISGTPLVGVNATKYFITAGNQNKQITIPLIIKSLFTPKFAYLLNTTSSLVNLFFINANNGVLTGNGTIAVGGGPESLGISPSQKYLTVANRSSNDLSQFSINQTNGNLSVVGTVPSGGVSPLAMTYHPYKDIVYIRNNLNIATFLVNQATGNLTLISTIPASTGASSIAVDPFGNYLYVPNYNSKLMDSYWIDPATGIPSPNVIQTIGTGAFPRNLEILSNGKNLYIVNDSDNNISTYQIDSNSGFLSSFFPATVPMGLNSRSVVADPSGKFLYMTNQGSDFVSIYGIDPSTGSLFPAAMSQMTTGDGPTGINIDSSGKFLYVTNFNANTVDIFQINQSNGSLTKIVDVATNILPIAIVTSGTNP